MNPKVERVTAGIREIATPYLGRREHGHLEFGNAGQITAVFPDSVEFVVMYQKVLGSTSGIMVFYDRSADVFEYKAREGDEKITTTRDPEEVLRHFQAQLDSIKVERLDDLKREATRKKQKGISPDIAIAEIRQCAEQHQPTEEEVAFFAEYYSQIFAQ